MCQRLMSKVRSRIGDCIVAAEACLYLCWSHLILTLPKRMFLLPAIRAAMIPRDAPGDPSDAPHLNRILLALTRWWPARTLCLQRSLMLYWLLNRRNLEPSLRIGVDKADAKLLAHAWVEINGQPIGEPSDQCQEFALLEQPSASLLSAHGRADR
jgi:hypothetical protein